jgi:hypothetical protein
MPRWSTYVLALWLLFSYPPQTISQSQPTSQPSGNTATDTKRKQSKSDCTNTEAYVNSMGQRVPLPENC